MKTKNVSVILSGGTGMRFGAQMPKQYLNLAGKMIIEHTLEVFENHPLIDEICIVANAEFHAMLHSLRQTRSFHKITHILEGGMHRSDSSYTAIRAYEQDAHHVCLLFHDAVRPFVSDRIITECIQALKHYRAVDVAIPSADTIIRVDPQDNTIDTIPQRSSLRRGQTPQAFFLETIRQAHQALRLDNDAIQVTDDCGLVKHYLPNIPIYVVQGEEKNIKITYPEDLLLAEKLIQLNSCELSRDYTLDALKNQVIVVYGGHSGIGEAIVELGRQVGAICIPFSRYNGFDLKNADAIMASLQEVAVHYGQINHVVNCAALLLKQPLEETKESSIDEIIQTNYTAAVLICKYALAFLQETHGSITLFTSSSYTQGRPFYALYSSTKAAIVNLTQALAQEWKPLGVRINALNPARTKTPMRTANFGEEPSETLLNPIDVARKTLQSLLSNYSGLIIDIKKGIDG